MLWEVTGADRQTGQERILSIEADTEDSARRRGNRRGLMVADVRPLDPNDSVVGQDAASALHQMVTARPVPPQPVPQAYAPEQMNVYVPQQLAHPTTMPPYAYPQQQQQMPAYQPVINITNTNVVSGGRVKRWSPGVAALLNFLIPGLGQLYKGQVINGVVWFCAVVVGYAFLVIPGLILHLCCIGGAASGDPYR